MTCEDSIRLHRFVEESDVEGPGVRATIWVQGCHRHCRGCFNRDTWDPAGGAWVSGPELAGRIAALGDRVEGITLTGGEPFEQAGALARLAESCRAKGLSVVTYSGFGCRSLMGSRREDWRALLAATDLLLAGPFREGIPETERPWVGSRNQVILPLTERYRWAVESAGGGGTDVEWRIDRAGRLCMNGMVSRAELNEVRMRLADIGVVIHRRKGRDL